MEVKLMREADKLLIKSYASFVIDTDSLEILEYNDYGGRFLQNYSGESNVKIHEIIEWDETIPNRIQLRKDKRLFMASKSLRDGLELVVIVQYMEFDDKPYYNVTIVDNLEDIRNLEAKSIDAELFGNGLFSNIFKYSPIGLVLVDSDTRLYKANKYMFDCFDLKYKEVIGHRFGNVFQCSTLSSTNFLCGEAEGCKNCKLRNGVTGVLNDNIPFGGVEIGHDFDIGGRKVTKWFTVSASPVHYGEEMYALVSFVDITQRVRMEERLRELGITDGLTKLYNRRHIIKLLSDAFDSNEFEHVSIALIDIDDFKMVNDNYGHLVGDEVLILLSDILRNELRFSDYVGRYGGEEFLIVFTNTQLDKAEEVLERVKTTFKNQSKALVGETISFSGGLIEVLVAPYNAEEHLKDVLSRTDKQLYAAKAFGKDRIKSSHYTPDMREEN